jgi:hypothetical protein
MPSGAPPAMQMAPLQFAQPTQTMASQLQGLGKNLASAGKAVLPGLGGPPATPIAPGAPIPGAAGPTAAGGPGGPQPLINPQAQVGQAGNPAAGPVGPGVPINPAAMPQPNAPGGGPPGGPPGGPQLPTPQNPYPQGPMGASGVGNVLQNMSPPQLLQWLQSISRGGGSVTPPGLPGSAAMQGAGMLNPSQFGG